MHALIDERRLLRFQAPAQQFFQRELSNVSGDQDRLHDRSEIYELIPQLEYYIALKCKSLLFYKREKAAM